MEKLEEKGNTCHSKSKKYNILKWSSGTIKHESVINQNPKDFAIYLSVLFTVTVTS